MTLVGPQSHSQPTQVRSQMDGGFEDGAVCKPDESPSETADHRHCGSSGGLSANGRRRNGEAGTGSSGHRGRTFNDSHAVNGSTEAAPEGRKGVASNGTAGSHRSTDSCGGARELRTPTTGDSMTLRLTEEEELAAFGGKGRGSGRNASPTQGMDIGEVDCPTTDIMRSGDPKADDMAMGGEDDGRRPPSGRRSSKRRRTATAKGVSSTEKSTQKNEDSAPSKRARAGSPSSIKNGSPLAQSPGERDGGDRDSLLNSPQSSPRSSTRASSKRAKFNRRTRQASANGGSKPGSDGPKSDALPSSSSDDDDGEKAPSGPTYSWISGGTFNRTSSTTEHSGVEIDFRGCSDEWTPDPASFTVRPGDVVLLNGGEGSPWRSTSEDINVHNKATRETLQIYSDRASREASIGALDPYIGYVERLWDESPNGTRETPASSSGMMLRTRWFLKREELRGVDGDFSINGIPTMNAKAQTLDSLGSRDLVLTDRCDDNPISSIVGLARVVSRRPLQHGNRGRPAPNGAMVCRYELQFASNFGRNGSVKLFPCSDGGDNIFKVAGVEDVASATGTEVSSHEGAMLSRRNRHPGLHSLPMSPRRSTISEGPSTAGKIMVGPEHQAVVPAVVEGSAKSNTRSKAGTLSQRMPLRVWDPSNDSDDVETFILDASSLLSKHLESVDMDIFSEDNTDESPDLDAETRMPREVNVDALLTVLHECRGNTAKAITKITKQPGRYVTIWTRHDRAQFDASYRNYRDSIRMIANTLDNKTCREAVDYQYRFKVIENFRRFKARKRTKAEEIMTTVDDRVMAEKEKQDARTSLRAAVMQGQPHQVDEGEQVDETELSNSEEETKPSAASNGENGSGAAPSRSVGAVNNRVRTWFRTAGGKDESVGLGQRRRDRACDVLTQIKLQIGDGAYKSLAECLKTWYRQQASGESSLLEIKSTAKDVLGGHPGLLAEFMTFLPVEAR